MSTEKKDNSIDSYVNRIKNYIDDKHSDYAMILKGEYGKGKTYFAKYILPLKIKEGLVSKETEKKVEGMVENKNSLKIKQRLVSEETERHVGVIVENKNPFIYLILHIIISATAILGIYSFTEKIISNYYYSRISIIILGAIFLVIIASLYTKSILVRYFNIPKYNYIYVSLYGIKSIEDLEKNTNKHIDDLVYKLLKENQEFINERNVANFINLVGTLNPLKSYLDVLGLNKPEGIKAYFFEFTYKFIKNKPKLIICIDDIDRKKSTLDFNDLLGFVNNITENEDIKVILIMHEDKLEELRKTEDNRTKDNLAKTAPFVIDYNPTPTNVFNSILDSHPYDELKFKEIMRQHKDMIISFLKAENYNYRLLKDIFNNYELLHKIIENRIIIEEKNIIFFIHEYYIRLSICISCNLRLQYINTIDKQNFAPRLSPSTSTVNLKYIWSYFEEFFNLNLALGIPLELFDEELFSLVENKQKEEISKKLLIFLEKIIDSLKNNIGLIDLNKFKSLLNNLDIAYYNYMDEVIDTRRVYKYNCDKLYEIYELVYSHCSIENKYFPIFEDAMHYQIDNLKIEDLKSLKLRYPNTSKRLSKIMVEYIEKRLQSIDNNGINNVSTVLERRFSDFMSELLYRDSYTDDYSIEDIKSLFLDTCQDDIFLKIISSINKLKAFCETGEEKVVSFIKRMDKLLDEEFNNLNLSEKSSYNLRFILFRRTLKNLLN